MTTKRKRSFWRKPLPWLVLLAIVGLAGWYAWDHRFGTPDDYDHMEAQFKYGSVGSDHPLALAPIPYWIWKTLPDVFPTSTTIGHGRDPRNGKPGYAAFGLVTEDQPERPHGWQPGQPTFDRPIGISKRRVLGFDFVGENCAFCHMGTIHTDKGHMEVLGGTGQNVDIELYFLYLFGAMTSDRFTADNVMPAIDRELARQKTELGWSQRLLYRYVIIPFLPTYLKKMERSTFSFINLKNKERLPEFGPGRVDTWALYKYVFMDPPVADTDPGTVDFPPLWNQKQRLGMRLHWDGNTDVPIERNVVSALAVVGHRVEYLDFDRLERITDWIDELLPPLYADNLPANQPTIDNALAARGSTLFDQQCGRCHSMTGDRIGRVEPIDGVATDDERFKDFIPGLAASLNKLGTDRWQLRNFRVEHGYVDAPLEGVWLRSPYLHNGSVPTLRDLLNDPSQRPRRFCRGGDDYDWQRLGFLSALGQRNGKDDCPQGFLYDTAVRGNSNVGHLYGTTLSDGDKDALIEFMKTL